MSHPPGAVRDSILAFLSALDREASVGEIIAAVERHLGRVPESSVRSYLNLNVPGTFERTGRGRYGLRRATKANGHPAVVRPAIVVEKAKLYHADCFEWLADQPENSVHAVVTDPPYGVVEYSKKELEKLGNGRGGIWRIPPSYDGHKRSPLPRFTVLSNEERAALYTFFNRFGELVARVVVPGGNVIIASNPILSHIVAAAMSDAGLELRGYVARLTMTMRGGDRAKNAHEEFADVSVMPRSQWEPWVVLRRRLDGRVQDNLRKWKTGGFRRISDDRPFGDVVRSRPTTSSEKRIAPHPSLKPQHFLRPLVRASLPMGVGVVLDPFAGSGSTLAAANAVGYESVGVESNDKFVKIATGAIKKLGSLKEIEPV
ncbi:DNA methyltransferase [Parvibaculum sp.]|uniref:DNA-methyltransferase n=2 Tax=Parvibaculum sp. TaxID=2024848 RepID=UPI003299FC7D